MHQDKEKFDLALAFEKDKFERELEIDEQFLALKQLPVAPTFGYNDLVPLTRDVVPVPVDSASIVSALLQISHSQEKSIDFPLATESVKKILIKIAARKATHADLEKCGMWDPRKHTYDIVKKLGYMPWLDVDQLGVGNALENSLADTLSDDVSIVIGNVSDEYAASTNCRQEFQFATSLNLKIIPLVVEPEIPVEGQKIKKDSTDGSSPGGANSNEKIAVKKSDPLQPESKVKPWSKGWFDFQINHTLYIDARNGNALDTNLKKIKAVQEIVPGAELNQKSSEGYKSIRDALIAKDNATLVEMLKNSDKDLNASVSGVESILNLAVANTNVDNLETIINKGLIINADGQTPLISAIQRNDMDILDLLLRKGANVNALDFNKNSALHVAVPTGSAQQCGMILFYNPKLEKENIFGYTLFLYAVSSINVETVRILLTHGEFDIFKILLEAKVPVNLPDEKYFTPIQNAVYRGKLDVLKEMAKLPNSAELFGVTNLEIMAAKYSKLDILQFFLSAECPSKYNLHSLLQIATQYSQWEILA
ncbi:hypothetical protein HK100_007250 [Physocladia obscura]|uniref:TIR domain-containing protein n=1 Tax=Physocladia obscura TaxID=109957 RepID=A0AAD5SPI7_9FUNG|nr:hypothetical protein HK100_007250 [Physocladia obscura]